MTRVVCLWGEERGAKPTRLVYAMIFLIDTWRPVVCVVEVWQIDGNPVAIRWQFFRVPVVVVFVFAKFLGFQGSKLGFQGLEVDFRVNEPPRRSISGSRNLRGGSANLHPPSAAFFETSAKPPRTSANLREPPRSLRADQIFLASRSSPLFPDRPPGQPGQPGRPTMVGLPARLPGVVTQAHHSSLGLAVYGFGFRVSGLGFRV